MADADGPDERRGLEAVFVRAVAEYRVSLADVVFDSGSEIGLVVAAYRRWLALEQWPLGAPARHASAPVSR